jgi:hypothetical protein
MIIIHKHGRLELLPNQNLPHNLNLSLEVFSFSHAYFFASIGGFSWFFKNKILATSIRQKSFSKFSHVAHMKWLSKTIHKLSPPISLS